MKKIILLILSLFVTTLATYATTLPDNVVKYIKAQVPNANIRFDGLVTFPDKTTYLPLIPAIEKPVENIEVTYSYPEKSNNLNKKPEVLVLNSNYVLLKVIKDKSGVTLSKSADYPITVKTGLLPQDLLVPRGLYIPEVLESILGNLKIPVGTKNNSVITKEEVIVQDEVTEFLDKKNPVTVPKIEALKNKLYFVSNYDSNYLRVINSNNTQPLYSVKLESIPKSIVPVADTKYLMITTGAKTYVDVVDIQREEIAKQINLTIEPSEIVIDETNKIAYIGAKDENALFIVDLKTMDLKHKVLIKGSPIHMAITKDGSKLVYQDKNSARLYVIYPKNEYLTKQMNIIPNISKLIATDNAVYVISRTQNLLEVITYPSANEQAENAIDYSRKFRTILDPPDINIPAPIENNVLALKKITEKPVDMILYKDKLYILGASKNQLDVYDTKTNNIVKTVDLPISGFSKKITRVEDTNYIIISNAIEEKYLIYDLDTNSTIQQIPLNTKINNLVIVKKDYEQNKSEKKNRYDNI